MLVRATDLYEYTIRATDGDVGRVNDCYFDDAGWTVRYFVVETGGWLDMRWPVLISPEAVGRPDGQARELPVGLTIEKVKNSPPIDTDKPVSRQHEGQYRQYFGWSPYWATGVMGPAPMPLLSEPPPADEPGDPHLRSTRAVAGYHVETPDGGVGHVEDFMLDQETWAICYLVINTRNWLPGKKVLLAPSWVRAIDWGKMRISVGLERERIKAAPVFDPSRPIDREYEDRLHAHYDQSPYWSGTRTGDTPAERQAHGGDEK